MIVKPSLYHVWCILANGPFLGNQAILTLENDKPYLKFLGVGRSQHVSTLDAILAKATAAVGGTYVGSPFYAALGQQEITVHAM